MANAKRTPASPKVKLSAQKPRRQTIEVWPTIAISAAAIGVVGLAFRAYRRGSLFGMSTDTWGFHKPDVGSREKFTKLTKSEEDFSGAY